MKTTHRFVRRFFWLLFLIVAAVAVFLGCAGLKALREASVIVEWSTASELDTVGFNILRGDAPDGPFTRVNDELILTQGDALTGSDYSFTDRGVEAGLTYFYLLEDVDSGGAAHRNGPIVVKAEPGGRIELGLAAVLIVFCVVGVLMTRRSSSEGER